MDETYQLRIDPRLLDLALQLYASATSAVSEFVAMAWDADASEARIELGEDALRLRHDGVIDEARLLERLLVVGRRSRAPSRTPLGREPLTAGALGLFSYLGIARRACLRASAGATTLEIVFDLSEIEHAVDGYTPRMRRIDAATAPPGLELVLSDLRLRRQPSGSVLRRSLSRRFGHLTDAMSITVDREALMREPPFARRFPGEGYQSEEVDGLDVRWAVGFAEKPLPEEERGIVIFSRGRLVQAPFTFLFAGGARGQLGLTYMSGELHVDELAELQPELDLRREIDWSDPRLDGLLEWGRALVRRLLREWSAARAKPRAGRPRLPTGALAALPLERQAAVRRALTRIAATSGIHEDRLAEIAGVIVGVFAETDADTQSATTQQLGLLVRRRIAVIAQLREMLRTRAREQPELQQLLIAHPWLIEPGWRILRHEVSLDRLIVDELEMPSEATGVGARRLDFFVLADTGRAVVVELKRPGIRLGTPELEQIQRYVYALEAHYRRMSDPSRQRRVEGVLVGSEIRADERARFEDARGRVVARTWSDLLQVAEEQHTEFLELVERTGPSQPRGPTTLSQRS